MVFFVDQLLYVLPIVCGGSVFVLICINLCANGICNHLEEDKGGGCFAFIVLQESLTVYVL